MIRNSTPGPEHRELLVAEKQWKEIVELAFEQLPEIIQEWVQTVSTVIWRGYKNTGYPEIPYPMSV